MVRRKIIKKLLTFISIKSILKKTYESTNYKKRKETGSMIKLRNLAVRTLTVYFIGTASDIHRSMGEYWGLYNMMRSYNI